MRDKSMRHRTNPKSNVNYYKEKNQDGSFNNAQDIITGRNEVVAKVIFLQVSVCPQGGGEGVCLSTCWDAIPPPPRWRTTPPRDGEPPPREADSSIRSTSGRYASYWNAYLFKMGSFKLTREMEVIWWDRLPTNHETDKWKWRVKWRKVRKRIRNWWRFIRWYQFEPKWRQRDRKRESKKVFIWQLCRKEN